MNTFSNKFITDEKNLALLKETMWGPNGIRQAEELASHFKITKDMKILDLGCGTGLSSLYLVQEHGVNVLATDLFADPTENHERFVSLGIADKITPHDIRRNTTITLCKGLFRCDFFCRCIQYVWRQRRNVAKFYSLCEKRWLHRRCISWAKIRFRRQCPARNATILGCTRSCKVYPWHRLVERVMGQDRRHRNHKHKRTNLPRHRLGRIPRKP